MSLKKTHRLRVVLLAGIFLGLAGAVGARLYQLQVADHDHYVRRAQGQQTKRIVIQPERGSIVDRAGHALAQSTGRVTLYVNPAFSKGSRLAGRTSVIAGAIATETNQDADAIRAKLEGSATVAIARRLRPESARRLTDLLASEDIDSRHYWLDRESIRLYPRHLAAAAIGFCRRDATGDNEGIAGLELFYNEELKGTLVEARTRRTGISQTIQPWEPDDLLKAQGNTLVLTIDSGIQEAMEDTLARTIEQFQAASAGAIVMDVHTGGIIAMASLPSFDNNAFGTAPPENLRNRLLTDPLETGSVVKLFTAAMLLDQGLVSPETLIDCEGGFAIVDGRRLRDSPGHVLHVATFRETMRWSSNVGIVKAAQALENGPWYDSLRAMNFGAPTGIDLPGEGSGILYPLERWTKFSRTSLPMGYEIAMTPVQITAALAAMVNGGRYFEPHLVAEVRDPRGNLVRRHSSEPARQVIRPTTSAIMRDLMEDVVAIGTGKKAGVPGYRVGGKTGTTRKSDIFDRREYIASFGGALPMQDPRVAVYVYIDAPQGEYYASVVAAPAFQEIARATVLHLGIAPTEEIAATPSKAMPPMPIAVGAETGLPIPVAAGRMPDLRGLSMAEVRAVLPREAQRVRLLGSGSLTDQYPAVGDVVNQDTELVLHFSDPSRAEPIEAAAAAEGNSR